MKPQKTLNSQNNTKKKNKSGSITLYNFNKSRVLVYKLVHRPMEEVKSPQNKSIKLISIYKHVQHYMSLEKSQIKIRYQ